MLPRRGSHGWKVIARTMIVRRPALQLPIELSTRQGSLWPNRSPGAAWLNCIGGFKLWAETPGTARCRSTERPLPAFAQRKTID